MKKLLPVILDTCIKTECWTYMRMCVIQAQPNYEKWLYPHMTMIVENVETAPLFGDYGQPHKADYYSDIIDTEELNIFAVSADEIVDYVKSNINEGLYISVFVKMENGYNHEVFIYGYDENDKKFSSIALGQHGFRPEKVDYEYVENGYRLLVEQYLKEPGNIFSRRPYNYLLSRIKPTDRYLSRDYTPDYFSKIAHETFGKIQRFIYTDENEQKLPPHDFYTGLTCLLAIKNRIEQCDVNQDEGIIYYVRNSMFKLLEHRRIILAGMKWYEIKWNISSEAIISARKQYEDCLTHMEQTSMMALKDDITKAAEHFNKISQRLSEQYKMEYPILESYFNQIKEWYFKYVVTVSM